MSFALENPAARACNSRAFAQASRKGRITALTRGVWLRASPVHEAATMSPFRKILVPTDFSDCSSSAADVAVDMANAFEASLVLMHAYELPGYDYWGVLAAEAVEAVQGAARAALDEALASVRRRCPRAEAVLRFGVPWEQILAAVGETGADLVAMGTHGRCGLRHVLMGSVTERVVRTSPVPVLTVCRKPQRAGA